MFSMLGLRLNCLICYFCHCSSDENECLLNKTLRKIRKTENFVDLHEYIEIKRLNINVRARAH